MQIRTRRGGLLFVGFALVFTVVVLLLRSREPQHAGKSLTDWLADYDSPQVLNWPRQSHPADPAILAIGTNSFPGIIQRLRRRDSKGKTQFLRLLRSISAPIPFPTQARAHTEALAALGALRSTAAPLVPELAKSLDTMDMFHQISAFLWLASRGTEAEAAVPTLLRVVADTNYHVSARLFAIEALSATGARQGDLVLPVLTAFLNDANFSVRLQATNALSREQWNAPENPPPPPDYARSNLVELATGTPSKRTAAAYFFSAEPILPAEVLPILNSNLLSTNVQVLEITAKAIGAYGEAGQESLPYLTNLLRTPRSTFVTPPLTPSSGFRPARSKREALTKLQPSSLSLHPLAFPLMPSDLKPRTKAFALQIIKLYADLHKSAVAQILGKQLLRSGTSVGANYREASRARSDAEFTAKCGDCLKELEETIYWLELLQDSKMVPEALVLQILDETRQLTAIFTTIDKKVKARRA